MEIAPVTEEAGGNEDARKQWHPILVDGLRYFHGDKLRIEPEHAVSALPTRIDILVMTPEPTATFASPYNLLAPRTLVELVGPGDWATWRPLRKLYVDGVLYSLDQNIKRMANIGLWLLASRMSSEFLELAHEELGTLEVVGPGLYQASFCGSPVLLVHLHELPLSVPAIPLLMVYRGPREREIAKFVMEQGQRYRLFAEQAFTVHAHAVKEVMAMLGMSREAFRQLANARDIVDLFGPEILIEEMGKEEAIRAIGEDEFIRTIGEEEVIRTIGEEEVIRTIGEKEVIRTIGEKEVIRTIGEEEVIRTIGEDRIRELLDEMAKKREGTLPGQP
jgi:hypothetical protein